MWGTQRAWPGVEVKHLAALAAVGRTGSFSAAAAELGYVQSAVSQRIGQLERAVGAPLVVRRPVRLTPAGTLLAGHARALLGELAAARADLRAPGALHVGVGPGSGPWLLPRVTRALPEVRLRLTEADDLERMVEDGAADAALGPPPDPAGPFAVRPVGPDTAVYWHRARRATGRLERFAAALAPVPIALAA